MTSVSKTAVSPIVALRRLLADRGQPVSELEYTQGNYDEAGKLIKEPLPTITTDFCEIGLHRGRVYLVFIVSSKTFDADLFTKLKVKSNVKMYGFVNFHKTLYPVSNFDFDHFLDEVRKDKYLQIQFDYQDVAATDLYRKYSDLLNLFKESKVVIVNQRETDLTKKN